MGLKTLTASSKGGGDFASVPPKAGSRLATLAAVVDIGIHETFYQGASKGRKGQIILFWEFARKEPEGSPNYIARTYTVSGEKMAALRKDLESWRGETFRDGDDIAKVLKDALGKGWLLNIQHKTKDKDDKTVTYANIASVGGIPEGAKEPKPSHPPYWFDADVATEFTPPDWLPTWHYGSEIAALIQAGTGGKVATTVKGRTPKNEVEQSAEGESSDDIPF